MYKRNVMSWLKHWDFMLVDFILFQVAFWISYMIRNNGFVYDMQVYRFTGIILALVDVCFGFFLESYKGVLRRGLWKEFKSVTIHVTVVTAALIFGLFIIQGSKQFSRLSMLAFYVISIILLYFGRILLKKYLRSHRGPASGKRLIALVGASENYCRLIDNFQKNPYSEFHVQFAGALGNENFSDTNYCSVEIISGSEKILNRLLDEKVDEVLISLPDNMEYPVEFIKTCRLMGITVHEKLALLDEQYTNQIVEKIEGYTVLSTSMMLVSTRQLFVKRVMDILGGIVGCLFTVLLTILIGPIIYVKSPGPIFFSQTRVGRNGRKFKIYKFRSMYMDAEERKKELMAQNNIKDGMMFKMDDDPRIIKEIGHFIRDFSIDEFPQFWNVLKGDMSLVGTRPPTVDEWEKYEYHHRARLAIKPGITGMWQVSGRSNITDFEEVVALDRQYITEWNIGLDIKILLKTVKAVLHRDGSM